jgi:hypothetical protein
LHTRLRHVKGEKGTKVLTPSDASVTLGRSMSRAANVPNRKSIFLLAARSHVR